MISQLNNLLVYTTKNATILAAYGYKDTFMSAISYELADSLILSMVY